MFQNMFIILLRGPVASSLFWLEMSVRCPVTGRTPQFTNNGNTATEDKRGASLLELLKYGTHSPAI